MSAQAYLIISITGYGMAALLFVIALFLFFHKNVIGIMNDLSGRTAAKQIIEIRKKNSSTESTHKVSSMYEQLENKGKVDSKYLRASRTSQMSHVSRRLDLNNEEAQKEQSKDVLWQSQKEQSKDMLWQLQNEQPTDVLRQTQNEQPTDVLRQTQYKQSTDVPRQALNKPMDNRIWQSQSEMPTDVLRQQYQPESEMIQYQQNGFQTNVLPQDESDLVSDSDQFSESDTTVLENKDTPEFKIICDVESVFTDEVIR